MATAWGADSSTAHSSSREVGYHRARLWTNDPLTAARHLYLQRGFRLVEEQPHHSFGVDLVSQMYELELGESLSTPHTPMVTTDHS